MEEIYANAEYPKPVSPRPPAIQTGPRGSERRFHGAAVLCLGLLSVFLLAGLIGLSVHYRDSARDLSAELSSVKANLTERLQATYNKLSSVSEERHRLNASLTAATKELVRLQKKTCPAGWRMFGCSCYLCSVRSGSWEKGRQDCRERGADLVVVDSSEEQEFLSKLIKQDTWLGLNDRDKEGTWKWIDETPLTVSLSCQPPRYWSERQPDNGGGDPKWGEEDCAHFTSGVTSQHNWNDLRCDVSLQWICEKTA
ncbi:CD209 antigen-like protein E [Enoplosus armatus]|uniref:CD209 antigen-like protein E n=1 Tax=Enoplosus armatus TaxID=215367 RepID=UPI00399164D9